MYNDDFEDMIAEAVTFCRNKERKFLEDWCREAKFTEPIAYEYKCGEGFTIYTRFPGYLIGKAGWLINKYRDIMHEEFGKDDKIKFVELRAGGFVNLGGGEN